MMQPPLNKDAIIDDIGFRNGWNEQTIRMNIETLAAMLAAPNPTVDSLRYAIDGLKIATETELANLQIHARDRMAAFSATPSAKMFELFKPTFAAPVEPLRAAKMEGAS